MSEQGVAICQSHGGLEEKSGKDDYDKFSLPTGSGFFEDTLKWERALS